jgi:hypothetical protein
MRFHLRAVAILAVGVVAYAALIQSFHLLNAASDRAVYGGIALIFGLILFVPAIVHAIWRRL